TIVGANPRWQPVLLEQAREDRLGLVDSRRAERLAAQEIAAEAIGHGEGIAVAAVARPKLPLVVGAPEVVGREYLARRLAGLADAPALAPEGHHSMPLQDVARRGAAGEAPARVALMQ